MNEYNFDIIDSLQQQGLAKRTLDLMLANINKREELLAEDRDPTQPSDYFHSRFAKDDNRGQTVFTWEKNVNGEVKTEILYCDITSFNLNRSKIIQKTNVVGSKNSIKEYIATDDYKINISGTFYNIKPDLEPVLSLNKLNEMVNYNGVVDITNDFLNNSFYIFDFIIENFNIKQSKTGNIQSFDISGISN